MPQGCSPIVAVHTHPAAGKSVRDTAHRAGRHAHHDVVRQVGRRHAKLFEELLGDVVAHDKVGLAR